MPTLFVLRGISGSGKSHFANRIQETNPGTVIVSRDDLRLALYHKDFGYPINEDLITEVEFGAIMSALKRGIDVISDNTHLKPPAVVEKMGLAQACDAHFVLHEVPTTIAQALENNRKRGEAGGRFVPEHVITAQAHAFDEYRTYIDRLVNPDL